MRLSRFDLTVLIVAAALILTLGASALLLRPQPTAQRVAYIAPADRGPQNVWAVVPGDPSSAQQVTFSDGGVYDFAPSRGGRHIAFAERDQETGRVNLKLADLFSSEVRMLADCASVNADCTTPAWRPDGSAIAYMRRQYDPALGGSGVPKIWLIENVTSLTPDNNPLLNTNDTGGSQPVWSGDGRRLAFYEPVGRGVLVLDFNAPDESQSIKFVPADNGMTGSMSPDGETLVTSTLSITSEQTIRSQLVLADLVNNDSRDLMPDGQSNDGSAAAWHPNGQYVAILRQYMAGEQSTPGQQVYLYDVVSGSLSPLIVDAQFFHGALSFSPDGEYLVVQRTQMGAMQGGIWVYEMATGALTEIAPNAYLPVWIPGSS